MHPRIVAVQAEQPYRVLLTFADDSRGRVDLAPWIVGHSGVLGALEDPAEFGKVRVDRDAGTIMWPNGADLDPDVLYESAQIIHAL